MDISIENIKGLDENGKKYSLTYEKSRSYNNHIRNKIFTKLFDCGRNIVRK
jgi:hypothetical protein